MTAGLVPAAEVVERGLAAARASAGAVVVVEDSSEAELRFAQNTTTTNGVRRQRTVTVVALQGRAGAMAAGVVTRHGPGEVEELVEEASALAAGAEPADDEAPLVEGGADAGFADPPELTDLGALGGALASLATAFDTARAGGIVLAGFAEHHLVTTCLGTSAGVRRRHVQPTGKLEVVARSAASGAGAWAGIGTPDLSTADVGAVAERLTRRLAWADRRVDLPPGRYEAVLPPEAVADLTALLAYSASGREAEDGSTVFSAPGGRTRVGDRLSRLAFEVRSDPAEPGLECAPFVVQHASSTDGSVFDNGAPVGRTSYVHEGRLHQLRYHRAGARRAGVEPAFMADNLIVELPGASATLDEMVAGTKRGLLLTCLHYIRMVDPATLLLTGLTRDGVYLVEDGEVTAAVNNFRFNESPVDLLDRASEVGRTERALPREWNEYLNRTAMPALRIPDFNMSTVSPAN